MRSSLAIEQLATLWAPKGVRASSIPNLVPLRPVTVKERDRDLIERVREGEAEAVAAVYRLHHRGVRSFARRMLGDLDAAEDVVHDVFVALPKATRRFRGDASLRTFLTGMALNLCRRHIRSTVRRRRAMAKLSCAPPGAGVASPESETNRRRLADALQRGLETLPLAQREAFVLCAVEERGSPEVAEILQVPEGTVRTRLFHARRKLRAFLEAEGVR